MTRRFGRARLLATRARALSRAVFFASSSPRALLRGINLLLALAVSAGSGWSKTDPRQLSGVPNLAALRTVAVPVARPGEVPMRIVLGSRSIGDEGGGEFYWDASSSAPDDGGVVIASTHPAAPPGRWRRAFYGPVHAAWWGMAGNGVGNDTAPLQAAFNAAAGRGIVFAQPLSYAFDPGLAVPAGVRIENNGAALVLRASPVGQALAITFGARVHADFVKVHVPAGVTVSRLLALGEDNDIGCIELTSANQQTNFPTNLDGALQIRFANTRVGLVKTDKFDKGVMVYAATRTHLARVVVRNYALGMHVRESSFVALLSAEITGASPTSTFVAGHNGILIEDSFDIQVSDVIVQDAGEHGVRVGGGANSARIAFDNIQAIRCGGCGLKVRANNGFRVRDVAINGLTVVDAGARTNPNPTFNQDGLRLENCSYVTANGVQVQAETRLYSAHDGIWVTGCDHVTINGPRITNVLYNGIHVFDVAGPVNQIYINDPVILVSATNGIFIESPSQILRDITVTRCYIRNFANRGIILQANSGATGVNQPVILDGWIRNDVGQGHVQILTTDPDVRNHIVTL